MQDRRLHAGPWRRWLQAGVVAGLLLSSAVMASAQTVRVEAESYTAVGTGGELSPTGGSSGIGQETRDAVGKDGEHVSGSYVTYFRNTGSNGLQEYLEYTVTVPSDGMYTIRTRAAYNPGNVTIRAWNLSYGPTYDETIDMTPSAGLLAENMAQFDMPYEMPMKAGENRIRFYMINRGINPDWFEFVRTGDITAYGMVQGQITEQDTGKPVGPAVVATDVFDAGVLGTIPLYGFHAVSDATGNYHLLLPFSGYPYSIMVGAQGFSDSSTSVASVNVSDTTTQTQNISVVANGRYEAEWFTNAETSPVENGKAFGMYDRSAGGTSWGRVIGQYEGFPNWLSYTVNVPSDGLYTVTMNAAPNNPSLIRLTTSTGYEFRLNMAKVSAYSAFDFTDVPLKAGANTLTFTNMHTTSTNFDYFTVTSQSSAFGTITGAVTNTAASTAEAGVTVTVTNAANQVVGRTTTDASGNYSLAIAPGTYTVTASKSGFDGGTGTSTDVSAGGTSTTALSVAPSGTIVLLPEQVTAVFNGATEIPRLYGLYEWSPTGQTIGNFAADSWIEFPFNVSEAGVYSVTLDYAHNATTAARVLSGDVHAEGSNQHFATNDTTFPSTGADFHTFVPLALADNVPLKAGANILRLYNVTTLHTLTPRVSAASGGSLNIGRITLARVGDLPATAPITGGVKSSALGMNSVHDAYVLANPTGAEVPEPSRFWKHGYWTISGINGGFRLDVPTGSYSVQAGRPTEFLPAGVTVSGVDVTAAGASVTLDLPSPIANGTLRIEDEYYTNKIPEEVGDGSNTGVALQPRTDASNGYVVGAIDSEDWVDFAIDVPTAGDYTITMLYYNELKSGQTSANTQMQFLANGTSLVVEDVPETVAGQTTPTSYTFAQTIHLNAGRNVIRQMMVVPRVESLRTTPYFDAFELTLVQPFQMARKALAIAGGLAEAGAADLTDLNVVTTGDSATVIDLLDAVELVRQGK